MGEKKTIRTFTDLDAWKEGHKIVLMVYKITGNFPKEEVFGLTSQVRRCSISITSNIAEGFSRQSYKDKVHFYSIAMGSLTELQSQIITAKDIGFTTDEEFQKIMDQSVVVHKILSGLIKSSKFHYR
jgi:four helix bundle protein